MRERGTPAGVRHLDPTTRGKDRIIRLLVIALALSIGAVSTVVSASAGGAQPGPWTNPIQPANRGAPIPGAVNGELGPALLVTVEGACRLAPGAASALTHLFADARSQGIGLGAADCYRPVEAQNQQRVSHCQAGNCACAAMGGTTTTGGTSVHGWGKAVDFEQDGNTTSFGSSGYGWLKANAARYGFNHPGWAEPGGSTCPEAWHWEWVGDGGTIAAPPRFVGIAPTPSGAGYRLANEFGVVAPFGDASYRGWVDISTLGQAVTGIASTPTGNGYWLAAADGSVRSFGDAAFEGPPSRLQLAQPISGIARTPSGAGYWLVGRDGGTFTFGDATFHGSAGGIALNQPIVGIASTPSGAGYWLSAADGGIFNYGDASFYGSTGGIHLNQPITGIAATPTGHGYELVAADGGVFSFGDAGFYGSTGGIHLNQPITGIAATPTGQGYELVAADGGVFTFGDATFAGSAS